MLILYVTEKELNFNFFNLLINDIKKLALDVLNPADIGFRNHFRRQ